MTMTINGTTSGIGAASAPEFSLQEIASFSDFTEAFDDFLNATARLAGLFNQLGSGGGSMVSQSGAASAQAASVGVASLATPGFGVSEAGNAEGGGAGSPVEGAQESADVITDVFKDIGSNVRIDIMALGKDFSGTLKGMGNSIKNDLLAPVNDALNSLLQNLLGGADSPLGSMLGPLNIGSLFGFAGGGRAQPRTPILVGERGPELLVPDISSTVVNNSNTLNTGRAGTSVVVNQNIKFDLVPGPTIKAMIENELPRVREEATVGTIEALKRGT